MARFSLNPARWHLRDNRSQDIPKIPPVGGLHLIGVFHQSRLNLFQIVRFFPDAEHFSDLDAPPRQQASGL